MPERRLPQPPWYFPPSSGRYDVSPALSGFGRDFGNGAADAAVMQLDTDFPAYRAAKLAARRERYGRHVARAGSDDVATGRVARFTVGRLAAEHPGTFAATPAAGGATTLACALTGESITLDPAGRLTGVTGPVPLDPPYADALDALASQVQEDLAVVQVRGGRRCLAAAHVCFPNGWAPEAMVGRDFAGLHAAVPGMEGVNRRGDAFADLMINATAGLVRFAWGLAFDDRLDHHPARARAGFDPRHPAAWLRVERQTIWGFPDAGAALFSIRTYLYACPHGFRRPAAPAELAATVRSMSDAALEYKGLAASRDELVRWLDALR